MGIIEIATLIIAVAAVSGLIATWIKNGRNQSRSFGSLEGSLKEKISAIQSRLDDPSHGLSAIKDSVDEQKLHCAKVSTALATKLGTAEREVEELKKKGEAILKKKGRRG